MANDELHFHLRLGQRSGDLERRDDVIEALQGLGFKTSVLCGPEVYMVDADQPTLGESMTQFANAIAKAMSRPIDPEQKETP